jgi:hypothetical protein
MSKNTVVGAICRRGDETYYSKIRPFSQKPEVKNVNVT